MLDYISKTYKKYFQTGPSQSNLPNEWSCIATLPVLEHGSTGVCFAGNETDLFAGSNGGVFRSTDNGQSWAATKLVSVDVRSLATHINTIMAATWGYGVWISKDKGRNWFSVNDGLDPLLRVGSLAVMGYEIFASNAGVFALAANDQGWDIANAEIASKHIQSLFVHGRSLYAATCMGLFGSVDNGKTWKAIGKELMDTHIFHVAGNENFLFVSNMSRHGDANLYRWTKNERIWTSHDTGLKYNSVRSIAIKGNCIFAAGGTGVALSRDGGESWTVVNKGFRTDSFMEITSLVISGTNLVIGTLKGEIWIRPLSDIANWKE